MSAYPFTYQKEDFSLAEANQAELFLMADKTEIALLITADGQLLAWKNKCPIEDIAGDSNLAEVVSAGFKKVTIGILPEVLTIVPKELYDETRVAEYARYLDVKADEKVFSAGFDADNQIIYKVDGATVNQLSSGFAVSKFVPAHRGWVNFILGKQPGSHDLHIDVTTNYTNILHVKDGKLNLYNSIKTAGIDDVLYYALYAVKQLELTSENTNIIIGGSVTDDDVNTLKKFFSNVRLNNASKINVPQAVESSHILSITTLA